MSAFFHLGKQNSPQALDCFPPLIGKSDWVLKPPRDRVFFYLLKDSLDSKPARTKRETPGFGHLVHVLGRRAGGFEPTKPWDYDETPLSPEFPPIPCND
ncbi:hypothetical protein JTE90_026914 [Oedothorax gibbosus]|uniref:Uncharacterized protein n=1 Tax=Oedothorax gibbosus TaxID=931172 RepID=A0AAV6TCV1_9ARAC|nr:hypothetical protein JTE90_026914 [Oedothorax gibbosus]